MQKGRQEGRKEGILTTCRKALKLGLSVTEIADITELPLEKVIEIKKSL